MKSEKDIIEADVKRYLRAECRIRLKVKPIPLASIGVNGVSDTVVPYCGAHMVECKRPVGGKLSPSQLNMVRDFNAANTLVWVIHDYDTVDAFINYLIAVYGSRF